MLAIEPKKHKVQWSKVAWGGVFTIDIIVLLALLNASVLGLIISAIYSVFP